MIDETKLEKKLFPTEDERYFGIKLSYERFIRIIRKCRNDEANGK